MALADVAATLQRVVEAVDQLELWQAAQKAEWRSLHSDLSWLKTEVQRLLIVDAERRGSLRATAKLAAVIGTVLGALLGMVGTILGALLKHG